MSFPETVQLLSDTSDLRIIKMRGIFVINTIPSSCIFGIKDTIVECEKCMRNASWRGVLIGACDDCSYLYHGLGGLGFPEKEFPHDIPGGTSSAPFGFYCGYALNVCIRIDQLMERYDPLVASIPNEPKSVCHDYAYSFYGIASLGENISLLMMSERAIKYLCERYHFKSEYRDKRCGSILNILTNLSAEFEPLSPAFFHKCEKLEKEWTFCKSAMTQQEVDEQMVEKQRKREEKENKCLNATFAVIKAIVLQYYYVADVKASAIVMWDVNIMTGTTNHIHTKKIVNLSTF